MVASVRKHSLQIGNKVRDTVREDQFDGGAEKIVAKQLNRLSAKGVTAAKGPAMLADGGGLYLRASATGAKSWVFVYRKGAKRTGERSSTSPR